MLPWIACHVAKINDGRQFVSSSSPSFFQLTHSFAPLRCLSRSLRLPSLHHGVYRCWKTIRSSYQMQWQQHLVHKKCTIRRSICRLLRTFGDILWCILSYEGKKTRFTKNETKFSTDILYIENALAFSIDMLTLAFAIYGRCVVFALLNIN